jgi:NAD(P)-dependent dehydrogenase (short-subunit alcohol dehydrogenase family)
MQSIDQPLKGKILLITGGASGTHPRTYDINGLHKLTWPGIGLELTKQSHELGAKVLVADLKTTSDFDAFAKGKDDVLYVQSDVSHWPDFTKMFDACEQKWNDVPDAYGICAGLFDPPFTNFWQDPEQEEGYKQVDVNVNHPIKLTRMAIRKSLSKGKRASVCIIVSLLAYLECKMLM